MVVAEREVIVLEGVLIVFQGALIVSEWSWTVLGLLTVVIATAECGGCLSQTLSLTLAVGSVK